VTAPKNRAKSVAGPSLPRGREREMLLGCAQVALARGALDEARTLLDFALVLDPRDVEALALAGQVHERLDRPDLARQAYAAALELDPEDPRHALMLARTQVVCAEDAHARALLSWVVTEFPEHAEATAEALDLLQRISVERV
jgi:Flp pilus assembly protein TadD